MSFSFSDTIRITIFGESHGEAIGLTIDGLPCGIPLSCEDIQKEVNSRRGDESLTTARKEKDIIHFLSGIYNGFTTGGIVSLLINNEDVHSESYQKGVIRPSHSDLTAYLKYQGFNDYRGGGFFSGRLSALFFALGEISKEVLNYYGYEIKIMSHLINVGKLNDRLFSSNLNEDYQNLLNKKIKVLDDKLQQDIKEYIEKLKNLGDSCGGSIETIIINPPKNLGEPYFDSFESKLSHLLFSLGGVKGVVFGDGEEMSKSLGSEMNDQLEYQNEQIKYLSNHNGGILGGITTGEPIIFKTFIKPTSSISLKQKSIDVNEKKNISLEIKGRHDACIALRMPELINNLAYYVILDLFMKDKVAR